MKRILFIQCFGQFLFMSFSNFSSVLLYKEDVSGLYSSYFQLFQYIGVILVGIFGSMILKKFAPKKLGRILIFINFVFITLFYFSSNPLFYLILGSFFSFFDSLAHPNYLRSYYNVLDKNDLKKFFSMQQFFWQIINIITHFSLPYLFKYLEKNIYFLLLPFLFIMYLLWPFVSLKEKESIPLLEGYRELFKNKDILRMTLHRLINQCFFSFFYVGLPVLIAPYCFSSEDYSYYHSYFYTSFSLGFLLLAYIQNRYLSSLKIVKFLSYFLSFALFLALLSTWYHPFIYLLPFAGFFVGVSQYCQRMIIILLGKEFTPSDKLTSIIISGDTLSRISSLLFGKFGLSLLNTVFGLKFLFMGTPFFASLFLKKLFKKTQQ
jgi:hypothetical protein